MKAEKPESFGITDAVVDRTYKQVQDQLEKAVKSAKSEKEFRHNLAVCQLYAQRTLAILIFNSSLTSKENPNALLGKIAEGIAREVLSMQEAAKAGDENLSSVTTELKTGDKNAH